MASIPQGAFATYKIKNVEKKMKVGIIPPKDKENQPIYSNKKVLEYTPVKYNSMLMKSIWGLYNRYSPHNIKKNNDADEGGIFVMQQQPCAVAAYAIVLELNMANDGKIWNFKSSN